MKNIVIIGAGGFGREVQWLIERVNKKNLEIGEEFWNILGYIDDGMKEGTDINGYKVIGGIDFLREQTKPLYVVCAIGSSGTRKKIIKKIENNTNIIFPNLIDPDVLMSNKNHFGKGNIVCAGTILTANILLQDFCIINLDCTVGHDAKLNSFTTVYPSVNISGGVEIEESSEIGTGSHIIQGIHIGKEVIIGAGAVVIKNIPDKCTAVGNPCKPIKYLRGGETL